MEEIEQGIRSCLNHLIEDEIIALNTSLSIITAKDNLAECGLESIGFMHLLITLEDYYNVEIPDEYLLIERANSIGKLTHIIASVLTG